MNENKRAGASPLAYMTGMDDLVPVAIIADEWNLTSDMVRKHIRRNRFPAGTAVKTKWGWFVKRRGALEALGEPRPKKMKYGKRAKKPEGV